MQSATRDRGDPTSILYVTICVNLKIWSRQAPAPVPRVYAATNKIPHEAGGRYCSSPIRRSAGVLVVEVDRERLSK